MSQRGCSRNCGASSPNRVAESTQLALWRGAQSPLPPPPPGSPRHSGAAACRHRHVGSAAAPHQAPAPGSAQPRHSRLGPASAKRDPAPFHFAPVRGNLRSVTRILKSHLQCWARRSGQHRKAGPARPGDPGLRRPCRHWRASAARCRCSVRPRLPARSSRSPRQGLSPQPHRGRRTPSRPLLCAPPPAPVPLPSVALCGLSPYCPGTPALTTPFPPALSLKSLTS